ncbi:sigma-70 family RNA polymerase sigma factor [Lacticaseibacillus sp. GG6-2]
MTDDALEALAANQGVVYAALKRAGVLRSHTDYDDMWMVGVARYVHYYHEFAAKYHGSDLNRLIGWRLRYDIQHARQRDNHRHEIEDKAIARTPALLPLQTTTDTTTIEVAETLTALYPHLKPVEQAIVRLRYEEGLNNRELAARLHLSPARIGQYAKHIAAVYKELNP